jgi:hypothetical protein
MDDPSCKSLTKIENILDMDILSKVSDMNSILGKSYQPLLKNHLASIILY